MFFTEHIYIYKKPYKLLPYNECSIKQYWQEILRKLWKTFPIFFNKIIFNNNSDDYISSIQKIIFCFLWLKLIPRTTLEFVQYAKKKKKNRNSHISFRLHRRKVSARGIIKQKVHFCSKNEKPVDPFSNTRECYQ